MSKPRIILIDIETSPLIGYCWGNYQTNVLRIMEPSKIISVAWKILGQKQVACRALPDYEGYTPHIVDDEKLIRDTWHVLDEADVVIAHHGDAFDLKKLNARFVYYGLSAPAYFKSIDTRKAAKKHFKFDSNKLDDLGMYLGEGQKEETGGFSLWLKCMAGDKQSWDKMKRYNIRDVDLLERIYLRLRPFMDNHPNLNVVSGAKIMACGSCLSENIQKRGFSFTQAGRKQRFQCNDCGSWSSGPYEKHKPK